MYPKLLGVMTVLVIVPSEVGQTEEYRESHPVRPILATRPISAGDRKALCANISLEILWSGLYE